MEPIRFCKQYYGKEKVKVNSCLSSCAIHTIVLTLLALICGTTHIEPARISLVLDFTSSETEEISFETHDFNIAEIQNAVDQSTAHHITDEPIELEQSEFTVDAPIYDTASSIPITQVSAQYLSAIVTQDEQASDPDVNHQDVLEEIIGGINNAIKNNRSTASGGIAGANQDVEDRLKTAGAKTGDVQISLSWNTIDDIDLHVKFTPGNGLVDNINWTNRVGSLSNGMLDIDMNAHSGMVSNMPVENVFWPPGSSPQGFFTVYVHFFRSWSGQTQIPVMVRIKNGADVQFFKIIAQLYNNPQLVKQFSYPANKPTKF